MNYRPFNPFPCLMSARLTFAGFLTLAALLLGAGCGGNDSSTFSAEADDPLYQQGQLLKKQGRNSEALATFIKVIEKRGEQASPESHLEVGIIYFQHTKDPIEAIHYFRKYLDLEPNSQQAPLVRQRVDLARRELFRTMPGRPSDDQGVRTGLGGQDVIDRLMRQVDDLQAENDRLRGVTTGANYGRTTRSTLDVPTVAQTSVPVITPDQSPSRGVVSPVFSPLSGMPPTSGAQVVTPASRSISTPVNLTPAQQRNAGAGGATNYAPVPQPTTAGGRGVAVAPTRPGATAPTAGKRHTIAQGETLYALTRKYGVTVEAILAVNRDVLPSGMNSKLSPGMVLKIP